MRAGSSLEVHTPHSDQDGCALVVVGQTQHWLIWTPRQGVLSTKPDHGTLTQFQALSKQPTTRSDQAWRPHILMWVSDENSLFGIPVYLDRAWANHLNVSDGCAQALRF